MSDITVAVAGPGDATPEAVKALLNDYFGLGPEDADGDPAPSDREIELIFPLREEHLSKGLLNVFAWSEYAQLPFTAILDKAEKSAKVKEMTLEATDIFEVANVHAKVIEMLTAKRSKESVLILLWGEGDDAGDEDTETLLDLALSAGIKVIDLTAALDDMMFTEPEPDADPEPEPPAPRKRRGAKPEPAAEKPARRGRARQPEVPMEQPEIPLVDEPTPEPPAKPTRKSRVEKAPVAAVHAEREIISNPEAQAPGTDSMDLLKGTLTAVYLYLDAARDANALLMLETPEEIPLAIAVREALEALEGMEHPVATKGATPAKRGVGRPAREVQSSDTTAYFMDGDGIVRVATRGRPRRGEVRVELTVAQVAEKTVAGLVDED